MASQTRSSFPSPQSTAVAPPSSTQPPVPILKGAAQRAATPALGTAASGTATPTHTEGLSSGTDESAEGAARVSVAGGGSGGA
jgi:hypothetical protein